eukprot:c28249_g1_i2 orf=399-1556(+)
MDRSGTNRPSSSTLGRSMDLSPLLGSNGGSNGLDDGRRNSRRGALLGAARFLRRASNRRMMREPSMLVRESAAEQLEERQSDWAYSPPVVVLDLAWNLAFVAVAVVVLILSKEERPRSPLRVWIVGYALQCLLHMVCVCVEYQRRNQQRVLTARTVRNSSSLITSSHESETDGEDESQNGETTIEHSSLAKRLESANTMFSFIWWIVGFYWIAVGSQALAHDSPRLYWLCVVFLAFDVFFVVFCVALACVIGIAVCCCLPCIIAVLYAVADQEGASEQDISALPKYRFHCMGVVDKGNREKAGPFGGVISSLCPSGQSSERCLSAEDAECCICLSTYDDGAELRELPCSHHFHCTCIDKWLRINATCPLCKYNIIKSNTNGREEV